MPLSLVKVVFHALLSLHCWLEERALRESMRADDAEWEERILLAHHRLRRPSRTLEDGSLNPEWEHLHKAFHMSLLSACGSSILTKICDQLYDQNVRYRNVSGIYVSADRGVGNEHDAILEHTLNSDEERTVDALLSHYRKTGSLLSDFLKREQGFKSVHVPKPVINSAHAPPACQKLINDL